MLRRRILPVLLILLVSIVAAEAAKKKTKGDGELKGRDLLISRGYPEITDEQRALTDVEFAKGAPAVVLLQAQEYFWEGLEFKRDRFFRRIKILDDSAIERHGSFRYTLWGDWRVKEVSARTILPDGTILDAKDGINRARSDNGVQVLDIAFPQVQVGAILDLDIQITSGGISIQPWIAQGELPVIDTRMIMQPPVGLGFRILPFRLPAEMVQPTGSIAIAGGGKTFVWRLENVQPLPDLAHMPPANDVAQTLFVVLQQYKDQFNYVPIAADWKSWGERRKKVWDEWLTTAHTQVAALGRSAAAEGATPIEKAEKVRLALRDRMRVDYVGDWATGDSPDQVLESGSGNTGSIAALTVAMLRAVDVPAELGAFRRRSNGIIHPEVPIPALMDDLMVRIPDGAGGELYFSPATDSHVSERPYECTGVLVFPLDGVAEAPVAVADFTAADNRTARSVRGELSPDGTLTATSTENYYGVSASRWRSWLKQDSEEEQRDRVLASLNRYLPELVLDSFEVEGLDDPDGKLTITSTFTVDRFASVAGKRLIFNPNLFSRTSSADWAPETRAYDIDLRMNRDTADTLMLKLPEGFKDIQTPDRVSYPAKPVGLYETDYQQQGQMLIAKRHARVDMYRIPAQYYDGLRRWFVDIAAADEKPIVVELQ